MRKPIMITIVAVGVAVLLGIAAIIKPDASDEEPYRIPVATDHDLETAAATTIFFAHQSVGYNMIDAIPKIYRAKRVATPEVSESREPPTGTGIVHTKIGTNGDPIGKIADFDMIMRSGMADAVDVAVLKLCYVDFRDGTDVHAIFAVYRDTFAALSRDYPDTIFVAATAPLTTERGPLGTVKAALGHGDTLGPEHNVVRQQFNSLMRVEYDRPGELFDIAAIQSTADDGDRITGRYHGDAYYAMDKAYASDPGHLNPTGARTVTSGFLAIVATAASER